MTADRAYLNLDGHVPGGEWDGDRLSCAEDGHAWPCPVALAFRAGAAVGAGGSFAEVTGLDDWVMEQWTHGEDTSR